MGQGIQESTKKYLYVEDNLLKILSDMVYVSRPYHFKFFKGCLPQILIDPFLNTLIQINYKTL